MSSPPWQLRLNRYKQRSARNVLATKSLTQITRSVSTMGNLKTKVTLRVFHTASVVSEIRIHGATRHATHCLKEPPLPKGEAETSRITKELNLQDKNRPGPSN